MKHTTEIDTTSYALEYEEPYEIFYIPVTISKKGRCNLYHQKNMAQRKSQYSSITDFESVFMCWFNVKSRVKRAKKLDKPFWLWPISYMMTTNAHLFINHNITPLIEDCEKRLKDGEKDSWDPCTFAGVMELHYNFDSTHFNLSWAWQKSRRMKKNDELIT